MHRCGDLPFPLFHPRAQEERGRRSLDRAVDGARKQYLEVLEIVTPLQVKGEVTILFLRKRKSGCENGGDVVRER